tara:strand:+ start:2294 stop:2497 length:204 start_codon:yes stop_codon:yes gene_type:complete
MSHKVIIELEFDSPNGENDEEQTVLDVDVYDYLQELIEDETLDYTVVSNSGIGYKYGKLKYKDMVKD